MNNTALLIAQYIHTRHPSSLLKFASGRGRKRQGFKTRAGRIAGVSHHALLRGATWDEEDKRTRLSYLAQANHILHIISKNKSEKETV